MCRQFDSVPGHHNLTPNCSQLGVSICTSRKPRGDRAHSACAGGGHGLCRRAAGLTLVCPLFSQNLHQLFRRGTRPLPSAARNYACVCFSGLTAGLDDQPITEAATGTERVTSARGKRVLSGSTRGWYRHLHGTRNGIHSRVASSPSRWIAACSIQCRHRIWHQRVSGSPMRSRHWSLSNTSPASRCRSRCCRRLALDGWRNPQHQQTATRLQAA